jgi:hypothetical protein
MSPLLPINTESDPPIVLDEAKFQDGLAARVVSGGERVVQVGTGRKYKGTGGSLPTVPLCPLVSYLIAIRHNRSFQRLLHACPRIGFVIPHNSPPQNAIEQIGIHHVGMAEVESFRCLRPPLAVV